MESYTMQGREHLNKTIGSYVMRHNIPGYELPESLTKEHMKEKVLKILLENAVREEKKKHYDKSDRIPRLKTCERIAGKLKKAQMKQYVLKCSR